MNHAADVDYPVPFNLWGGEMEICMQTTKAIWECITDHAING
jgi:hypothetical protein